MSTTTVPTPTSLVRLGHARVDVTPPIGIYHRMWGAARHDRATGVHRPLIADVLALAPLDGDGTPLIRVHLDAVGLARPDDTALRAAISEATCVPVNHIQICCSHTHSGGLLNPDRVPLPGGDLIPGHHAATRVNVARAAAEALAHARPATITYGTGTSAMGANRDYRDVGNDLWACGFNPDAPADQTVTVLRATADDGAIVVTAVGYAAHPTSLAWENTLISPDYPGALREVVEAATGAPCAFMLFPCGDQGPRDNYVGGPATADANGRQVGYAALAVLEGMGSPATDRAYEGPVVSGATLGVWRHSPHDEARRAATTRFEGATATVDIPRKPGPSAAAWRAEVDRLEGVAAEADARGDTIAARNAAALAERARRWAGRLTHLPEGATDPTYPLPVSVFRIGDVIWATCAGEPYAAVSVDLRRRFPGRTILLSPLDGPAEVGYLLTAESYGKGLYQEEPSLPGAGSLEVLGGAIAGRIAALER
jgi:hypothetical protein